jgi:hypothetical protein
MRTGRQRATAAACCGFSAAALALVVTLLGANADPSYSHVAHYISELGASGAPHARLVAVAGFAPIGALFLAFLVLASGLLPTSRAIRWGVLGVAAVGVAYLVSAVFPCDAGCPTTGSASQTIHNVFGLLEYVGAIAGFALLGAALRRASPVAGRVCALCAAIVAVGFLAMLIPALDSVRGASQRIAEVGIFAWLAAASWFVLRRGPVGVEWNGREESGDGPMR